MVKRHDNIRIALYFFILALLVVILALHMFNIFPLKTDFFAKFIISLVVVVALLPVIARIKFFDLIEVKRETRFLKIKK